MQFLPLECSPDLRCERLLQSGTDSKTQRHDDDLETIKRRFLTFENTSMEVIGHLDRQERLTRVNANQVAAAVFERNSKKMLEVEERGGKG